VGNLAPSRVGRRSDAGYRGNRKLFKYPWLFFLQVGKMEKVIFKDISDAKTPKDAVLGFVKWYLAIGSIVIFDMIENLSVSRELSFSEAAISSTNSFMTMVDMVWYNVMREQGISIDLDKGISSLSLPISQIVMADPSEVEKFFENVATNLDIEQLLTALFKTALQKLKPEDVLAIKNVASTLLLIGILPSPQKWGLRGRKKPRPF
jgi:hypothetical protein